MDDHPPVLLGITPDVIARLGVVVRGRMGSQQHLHPQDVEDAVSYALMQAQRHNPCVTNLFAWLTTVAINQARDMVKHGRHKFSVDLPDQDAELPGHEASVIAAIDLREAMRRLPDRIRRVLWLHDHVGLKHVEIAEQFGVNVGTIKMRLHRARKMMRKLMRDHNTTTISNHPHTN